MEEAFPAIDNHDALDTAPMTQFMDHEIHDVLAVVGEFRPSVDIFVE